jgi:hypothetical protein
MKSRLILPVMVALLASETFAGNLPSTGASASNWIPASPHQVQVLGLSALRGTEDSRFSYTRKSLGNTYNGLPVSRHQLEVFGFRSNFAVLPSVATAIAIGADWADPALDRIAAIEGHNNPPGR